MEAPVLPGELLARYLLSRTQFSSQKRVVKSSAFMPPPSGELSVFRTEGMDAEAVWELGERCVAGPQGRTLWGRADVLAGDVGEVGLTVDADDDPPRHANIVGWPEEKDAQKMLALELAERASLSLRSA